MKDLVKYLQHPAFITGLIIIFSVVGVVLFVRTNNPELDASNVEKQNWSWGDENSNIKVEVFSDFQCPACASYYSNTELLLKEQYSDDIEYTYKHFPLRRQHLKAQPVAEASEAAGRQGKFWEYHDIIYERQDEYTSWDTETYVEYAKEVGVEDLERFEKEVKGQLYRDVVEADYQDGLAKGVTGTPTVFINGNRIEQTYAAMSQEINRLISENSATDGNPESSIDNEE